MTLSLALCYVLGLALALRAASLRSDPRVISRLIEGLQRPGARGGVLAWVGRRAVPSSVRTRAASRAGMAGPDVERLFGTKVSLAVVGVFVGAIGAASPTARMALAAILGAGGFAVPSFRAGRRRAAVSRAMRRDVADTLDIVAVAVSAGLTPRLALERASTAVPDPLAAELDAIVRDVALGVPWLRALSTAASRTGLHELRRLAATLARSERLGSPVAERLRALARDVRADRRAETEERARRAPVAMLFPLVFLILPAFVLTAVVPAVLVATRGIRCRREDDVAVRTIARIRGVAARSFAARGRTDDGGVRARDPRGGRDRRRADRVGAVLGKAAGVLRLDHRPDHGAERVGERASAAVELALVLPLALLAALAIVQVGLVAKDALVVHQAAREGAREAVVTTDDDRVRDAALRASGFAEDRTEVEVSRAGSVGDPVTVVVRYRAPFVVPFVEWLFPEEATLTATATMRQEAAGTEQ